MSPVFPLPAILIALLLAAVAAAVAFAVVRFFDEPGAGGGADTADASQLTMADAFGLGGLPDLRAPNPDGGRLPSPVQSDLVVSYYGAPQTPSMGILGQYPPQQMADLLDQRAAAFRFLTRSWDVLPAVHLVYAVAQPDGAGDSLRYLDDRTVRQYIAMARSRGFITILDLQIGHSDPLAVAEGVAPYLAEPDVFVALDPEFALPDSANPGEKIGSIDARGINEVQAYLALISAVDHLPKKMLIVHQFEGYMITDARAIERRDDVDLVVDMDGYGPADIKEAKYQTYSASTYAPHGGIKIFLQHDPDPLSEWAILSLQPRPALVVYQ